MSSVFLLIYRENISWQDYFTFCNNSLVFISSSGFSFMFKQNVRDRSWLLADTLGEDDYALSLHFATNSFSGSSLGLLANLSRYFCSCGLGRAGLFYLGFLLGSLERSAFDCGVTVGLSKVLLARRSKLWVKEIFYFCAWNWDVQAFVNLSNDWVIAPYLQKRFKISWIVALVAPLNCSATLATIAFIGSARTAGRKCPICRRWFYLTACGITNATLWWNIRLWLLNWGFLIL